MGANGTAWLLGRNNTATITTQLGGASGANGPMLDITNNNAGTDDTALSLNVQGGEPPVKVNSDTRVANLNSDKLDGQEASAFLGANQKASDSDKLDGLDFADFGKAYKRTVVVSPVGTDTQNGQALLNALSGITDASATKPYLIHIEPATYELGTALLEMQPWVAIEGSGELNTIITSAATPTAGCGVGTVNGADNAEMRFLTVRAEGVRDESCLNAIYNDSASPRLTHVTAEATGLSTAGSVLGVLNVNSSPTITDVTATASGGLRGVGVMNLTSSSPTMTNVTATASGGGNTNFGVYNSGNNATPTIRQSKLSGTTDALFIFNGLVKVALSQLVGGVSSSGSLQCFNNYDENVDPVTC